MTKTHTDYSIDICSIFEWESQCVGAEIEILGLAWASICGAASGAVTREEIRASEDSRILTHKIIFSASSVLQDSFCQDLEPFL